MADVEDHYAKFTANPGKSVNAIQDNKPIRSRTLHETVLNIYIDERHPGRDYREIGHIFSP
jgi:hypothetical protein